MKKAIEGNFILKGSFHHLNILSLLTKICVPINVHLLYSYNCLVKIV